MGDPPGDLMRHHRLPQRLGTISDARTADLAAAQLLPEAS